ncbi:MAG: phosphoheptose isomerase [Bryobacterales bacterium]|jgi:phosphoheptose isomerase|nr:phosphoheptose isomerase [Bryobacterales bacterium]
MMTTAIATPTSVAVDELIETLTKFRDLSSRVDEIAQRLITALQHGNKILTCGNGGSAADALHMAEELVGRYKHDRRSLPAISLAADPTLLTCIGNDYGFDKLFSRQIEGLAQPGDIVVMFSSSGNSSNLLAALTAAEQKRVVTVALLGKTGGFMAGKADYEIIVPGAETARIQEVHTLILHSWLEQIDSAFTV